MKTKMWNRLALVLACVCAAPVDAAEWQIFGTTSTDNSYYFFDRETVSRQGNTVTVWIKNVNNPTQNNEFGVYAIAAREVFNCVQRTYQTMTSTNYDKNEKFIRSYPKPDEVVEARPGSVYAAILKVVCTSDFPKDKSGNLYYPATNNDIFQHAAKLFEFRSAIYTDSAPK